MSENPRTGMLITFVAFLACLVGLVLSYLYGPTIATALFAGAVGGIGHEFAQSGGTIALYQVKDDGVYLGSLAGFPIGAIAGMLFFLANSTQALPIILSQSLLAGLGFKGVAEAVGGQATTQPKETVSLENVVLDATRDSATITVRNTGTLGVDISKVYVGSQAFDQGNFVISPEQSHDFTTSNINPALVAGTSYPVRVVTAKGTSLQSDFKAS